MLAACISVLCLSSLARCKTVLTVVAKDTMSAMVKLAEKFEESFSDVIGYGMVPPNDIFPREVVESNSLGQLNAGCKLMVSLSKSRRLHG